jgi:hypothetical protein
MRRSGIADRVPFLRSSSIMQLRTYRAACPTKV